jgi:hypothetical protein
MAKIRYIGKKERRADTMYGTGLVWHGHGDVQTCEDPAKAKLLLRHADMFELVGEGAAPAPAPSTPGAADVLSGTNVLGGTIILNDRLSVHLSDVVRAAYEESGLSVQAWNGMAQPERDRHILAVVERARTYAAKSAPTAPSAPINAPAPGTGQSGATAGEQAAANDGGGGEANTSAGDGDGKPIAYRMASENGPVDLTNLDKDTLRRLAKSVGLSVSNNAGEDTLRRKLAEAHPVV